MLAEEERWRGRPRRRSLLEDIGSLEVQQHDNLLYCLVEESVVLGRITSTLGDTLGGEFFWLCRTTPAVLQGLCGHGSARFKRLVGIQTQRLTRAMDTICLARVDHAQTPFYRGGS